MADDFITNLRRIGGGIVDVPNPFGDSPRLRDVAPPAFQPVAVPVRQEPVANPMGDLGGPAPDQPVQFQPVAPAPTASREASLDQLRKAASNPDELARLTLARERGNDLGADNAILRDREEMDPVSFQRKYGPEVTDVADRFAVGGINVRRDANAERESGERTQDAAISVGKGLVQSLAYLAVPFARGNPILGERIAQGLARDTETVAKGLDTLKSDANQRRNEIQAVRAGLDREDEQRRRDADQATDGSFVAGLRSLGRQMTAAGGRLVEDPMMLEQGVAEGVGSMLSAGPASRAIGGAFGLSKGLAFPLTVGSMEGGGAYSQVVQDTFSKTDADLRKQSPEYVRLRDSQGLSEDEAKTRLADRAGLVAMAISGPVGAATSKLVEGVETNLIRSAVASPRTVLRNAVKEKVEEGIQSGAGGFAANAGERATGLDPSKDLVDDVGTQAAEGAAYGFGASLVQGTPGLAGGAAAYPFRKLAERGRRIREANEAGTAAPDTAVREAFDLSREGHGEMVSGIREDVVVPRQEDPFTPEQIQEAGSYLVRVENAHKVTDEDLAGLPENLQDLVVAEDGTPVDRLGLSQRLAEAVVDESRTPAERLAAATQVLAIDRSVEALVSGEPEAIARLRGEDDARVKAERDAGGEAAPNANLARLQAFRDAYSGVRNTRAFQAALAFAEKGLAAEVDKIDVASVDPATPEGKASIDAVVRVAESRPEALSSKAAGMVLDQAKAGAIELSEPQVRAVEKAQVLALAGEASGLGTEARIGTETGDRVSWVNRQIESGGGDKLSLGEHADAVSSALAKGDAPGARAALERLQGFAASMANKVGALSESAAQGGRDVPYQAMGPRGWLPLDGKQKAFLRPGNAISERLARQVEQEAQALAALYNGFVVGNGELGLDPLPVPSLDLAGVQASGKNQEVSYPQADPAVEARIRSYEESARLAEEDGDAELASRLRGKAASLRSGPAPLPVAPSTESVREEAPVNPTPAEEARTDEAVGPTEAQPQEEPVAEERRADPPKEESKPAPKEEKEPKPAAEAKPATQEAPAREPKADPAPPAPKKDFGTAREYPSLIASVSRRINWFHRAFRVTRKESSRVQAFERPFEQLAKWVADPAEFARQVGLVTRDYVPTDTDVANAGRVLKALEGMKAILDQRLQKASASSLGKLLLEEDPRDKAGNEIDPLKMRQGRILNLAEVVEGKLRYDQRLVDNALLAGADWFLNQFTGSSRWTTASLAGSLGVSEDQVDPLVVDRLNSGVDMGQVKRALARRIQQFWGVEQDTSVTDSVVEGIPEAMAAEVLEAMVEAGWIRVDEVKVEAGGVVRSYNVVTGENQDDGTKELVKRMNAVSTVFGDLGLVEREAVGPSREIPKKVSRTQLRNPGAKLTPNQVQQLEAEQAIPRNLNVPMAGMVLAMGPDLWRMLMGGREIDKAETNEVHAASLDGQNRGLASQYDAVRRHLQKAAAWAEANGKELSEVLSYYAWEISSVGRAQQQGEAGDQSSKLAREIFTPTRSTIDLTDEAQRDAFVRSLGQAFGVKVEYALMPEIREKVREAMSGRYRAAIDATKAFLESSQDGKDVDFLDPEAEYAFPDELQDALARAFRKGNAIEGTMHTLHGILAAAQYERALEAGTEKAFETHLYLEADGKTNGPINAIMLFGTGPLTEATLGLMRKGGIFLGAREGYSLNDWFNSGREGARQDLYQLGAETLGKLMAGMRKRLGGTPVGEQQDSLLRLMSALGLSLRLNANGDLEIERSFTKNPLTVTVYGSGVNGIAGKVTGVILEALYERMSQAAREGTEGVPLSETLQNILYGPGAPANQFARDLRGLMTRSVARDGKALVLGGTDAKAAADFERQAKAGPIRFKVTPAMRDRLQDNVRLLLVQQLDTAIKTVVMAEVQPATRMMKIVTQVQSAALRAAFRQEVVRVLEAKASDPSYKSGDALSKDDASGILERLRPLAPVLGIGDQVFDFSGSEGAVPYETLDVAGTKVSLPKEFARSLTGNFSTPATMRQPGSVGVAAIASMTQGFGDGQMQLVAANEGVGGGGVFDGRNLPVGEVGNWGRAMNEAARKAWRQNGLRALAESLDRFLAADPMSSLSENAEFLAEVTRILTGSREGSLTAEQISGKLREELAEAYRLADSVEARQKAFAALGSSTDQMASADAPYLEAGTVAIPEAATDADLVRIYNEEYAKALPKMDGGAAKDPSLEEAIASVAVDNGEGSLETDADGLRKILNQVRKGLAPGQQALLRASLPFLSLGEGYRILFAPGDGTFEGRIDTGARTIVLASRSVETMLHELIHAATVGKLSAFYQEGGKGLSDAERGAIRRIEALMGEWLSNQDEAESTVRGTASAVVQKLLAEGNDAGAMSEFMAWVLANPELSRQAASQTVLSKLARIAREALTALQGLVFGSRVGDDLLTQLRFNALVVMENAVDPYAGDMVLDQAVDERGARLRESFEGKVGRYLDRDWADEAMRGRPSSTAPSVERAAIERVLEEGKRTYEAAFPMTPAETDLFRSMLAALATTAEMDPNALGRAAEIQQEVLRDLKAEDFLEGEGDLDRDLAEERLAVVRNQGRGNRVPVRDASGRSLSLGAFLALNASSQTFRDALARMQARRRSPEAVSGLDARILAAGDGALDRLGSLLTGDRRTKAASERLMGLAEALGRERADARTRGEILAGKAVDGAEDFVGGLVQRGADALVSKAGEARRQATTRRGKAVSNALLLAGRIVSRKETDGLQEGVHRAMNSVKGKETVRDLVRDLQGRTKDNAPVRDLVAKAKYAVEAIRQSFVEGLRDEVAARFGKGMDKARWTAAFKGIASADLGSLVREGFPTGEAIPLLADPAKAEALVSDLEAELSRLDPAKAEAMMVKARQLANFLVTGGYGAGPLLRNADAIVRVAGSTGRNTARQVEVVDGLASLYALGLLDRGTRETLAKLASDQGEAMAFAVAQQAQLSRDEKAKAREFGQGMNYWKGYSPRMNKRGVSLVVATRDREAQLRGRGFVRLGTYEASKAEPGSVERAYWFSPVSGQAMFNQGIMHVASETAGGVDANTGYTTFLPTAGRITDKEAVNAIRQALASGKTGGETLLPVFDERGSVVAYERALDPRMLARLEPETALHTVLGAWAGRQAEEAIAEGSNRELVRTLAKVWQDGKALGRSREFVDVTKVTRKEDPVLYDAWRLVPVSARKEIVRTFRNRGGEFEGFMVRRGDLVDALGYRQASVTDLFTGETRMDETVRKSLEDLALGLFGNKAFPGLARAEGILQAAVSNAKVTIVVKSVVVPAANLASNMVQLIGRGVPLRTVLTGVARKTKETNDFIRLRDEEIRLRAGLTAAEKGNQKAETSRIQARLQAIGDAYRRMSIAPLIEAGMFSTISSGAVRSEDLALAEGRFGDWAERLAERSPAAVAGVIRYGFVTKDTALYRGLARATQYGDFVAKAVLYDELLARGRTREQALGEVQDEFVNYAVLPGRGRGYLESVGALWFYNYKLRMTKVALRTLRDRPLTSLLLAGSGMSVPLNDSLPGVLAGGRIGYSVGPGMLFGSFGLNPWVNLVD